MQDRGGEDGGRGVYGDPIGGGLRELSRRTDGSNRDIVSGGKECREGSPWQLLQCIGELGGVRPTGEGEVVQCEGEGVRVDGGTGLVAAIVVAWLRAWLRGWSAWHAWQQHVLWRGKKVCDTCNSYM